MVSIDFFTVPTIRFQILYVFLVLAQLSQLRGSGAGRPLFSTEAT
jgi:hypothetical protein